MFLRLHNETLNMRIATVNGFGKSGQQRIGGRGIERQPGSIAPGFVIKCVAARVWGYVTFKTTPRSATISFCIPADAVPSVAKDEKVVQH